MMHRGLSIFFTLILFSAWAFQAQGADKHISSPSGNITVHIGQDERTLFYSIDYNGQQIIKNSKLGFILKGGHALGKGAEIQQIHHASHDTTWEQPWGEKRFIRDHYNQMQIDLASPQGFPFSILFRLFDDGVAFRYVFNSDQPVDIIDELSEFNIKEDGTAWWIPGREWNRYEYLYNTTPIKEAKFAHTPFTVKTNSGTHISIHEAALIDYAGMSLLPRGNGRFEADLAPWSDGIKVKGKAHMVTPWRTIQISPNAGGLLESNLILNLNEPNKLGDVSWVTPGKYVGIWWGMHLAKNTWGSGPNHGATTEETKKYIDFASKYGFNGVLVEGWNIGWDGDWYNNGDVFNFTKPYPDFDMVALAAYAKNRKVKLIGHHETSGGVTNYENQLNDALKYYADNGLEQIKTGYVADGGEIIRKDQKGKTRYEWHDGQFMARHYLKVVQEAAKHKLSINTHEPIKDTGLRRTYPNWISREGARGQEYNAWGSPGNPPEHTTILPFTRMLSGPMDFTPGIFDLTFEEAKPDNRVETTLAKQLALYVVIYSPIQMAADLPENYEANLKPFQFIIDVPTDWEDTKVLESEIGDYTIIARKDRASDDWYLGAITDESAREISIPLSFLENDTVYEAQIYRDGDNADWKTAPYDIKIEVIDLTAKNTLTLKLTAGGGTAIRFKRK
jgi:alpha-glucosidase